MAHTSKKAPIKPIPASRRNARNSGNCVPRLNAQMLVLSKHTSHKQLHMCVDTHDMSCSIMACDLVAVASSA